MTVSPLTARPSYEAWMAEVDALIGAACGMSVSTLPRVDYGDMFESEADPAYAAKIAVRVAGFGGSL